MPNLVGQQFSTYHLTRLRERTAFTEIYTAEQEQGETEQEQDEAAPQVDFKALRPELSTQERELFLDAAQALLALTHPNITRVLEVGQATSGENSFPYLVVEHISDQTLRQLHPIGASLAPATILAYVKPVADALYYAHQQNFVHGDVKPGNMFVGTEQKITLSDFSTGLLSRLTDTVTGTIAYVAPEQLQEQPLPASDQYALGIIVYEWLTGELPFSGSVSEISNQHLQTPPPSLRAKIPALSQALEDAVLTALAKEPEQRFASVLDFANALETALAEAQEQPFTQAGTTRQSDTTDDAESPSLLAEPSENWMPASLLPDVLPSVPGAMLDPDVATPPSRSLASSITRRALLIGVPTLAVMASAFASWYFNQKSPTLSVARNATLLIYRKHTGPVTALAWSPDSAYLASGGDDHTIQIWHAETGQPAYTFHGLSGGVPAIAWAPDSKRIASGSAGPTTSGGEPAQSNTVQVWDALTGKAIYTYKGHTSSITDIIWDPKSDRIASASTDYTVQIWDATTGLHPLVYPTSPWYVWSLAWSPDARWIATGGPDTNLQIWDATTGKSAATYQGHTSSIETVAWSPNGSNLASGSDDSTVRVWQMLRPTSLLVYSGHTDYVRSVAWSPNGQYIASGSSDTTVQVWHALTGANVYTYRGHSSSVSSVVWSPNGKFVVSSSEDGTVQIWQPF
jgi:WD40 repeat protein